MNGDWGIAFNSINHYECLGFVFLLVEHTRRQHEAHDLAW